MMSNKHEVFSLLVDVFTVVDTHKKIGLEEWEVPAVQVLPGRGRRRSRAYFSLHVLKNKKQTTNKNKQKTPNPQTNLSYYRGFILCHLEMQENMFKILKTKGNKTLSHNICTLHNWKWGTSSDLETPQFHPPFVH